LKDIVDFSGSSRNISGIAEESSSLSKFSLRGTTEDKDLIVSDGSGVLVVVFSGGVGDGDVMKP